LALVDEQGKALAQARAVRSAVAASIRELQAEKESARRAAAAAADDLAQAVQRSAALHRETVSVEKCCQYAELT
jgi:hypothetical protein